MKQGLLQLLCLILLPSVLNGADTRYVDLNSTNPTQPYTSWATAATNIQDAIDAAVDGDLVLVTNGVYGQGGRVVFGSMTNRVAVTKSITVQSVNGPGATVIQGNGPVGDTAVRCVYLTNGARLFGFTVTNGATRLVGDTTKERSGGGIWCESNNGLLIMNAFVSNSIIAYNRASQDGGGGFSGQYRNCVIMTNVARFGAGISRGGIRNCLVVGNTAFDSGGGLYNSSAGSGNWGNTIVGNSASSGGGVLGVTMINSVIYFNSGGNHLSSTLSDCCTTPMPIYGFTNAPLFADPANSDFRLQSNSPCINAGYNSAVSGEVDLAGNPRLVGGGPDIGAHEFQTPSSLLSYVWAQRYGLPTDGTVDYADPDGDGMSNYGEWRSDTVPTNAVSFLQMVTATNSPTGVKVVWRSTNTRTYFLERATNLLGAPAFQIVASDIFGVAGVTARTDTTATNGAPYFYRVGVH